MPMLHVAWLRFKPGISAERIDAHLAACRGLVGKVPVVRTLQCGHNLSNRAEGLTHGIVVTLDDYALLPAYLEHPAHLAVVTGLKEDIAELRVMDIQCSA